MILMVHPEEASTEQLLLCPEDYPQNYRGLAHPDDYLVSAAPIAPEYVFNHRQGRHNRLLLRISWKLSDGAFAPATFVVDTGAPKHLYLCEQLMRLLEVNGVVQEDADNDLAYVVVAGRKCPVEATPAGHAPANLIGLKMLMRLGLSVRDAPPYFAFAAPLEWLG